MLLPACWHGAACSLKLYNRNKGRGAVADLGSGLMDVSSQFSPPVFLSPYNESTTKTGDLESNAWRAYLEGVTK